MDILKVASRSNPNSVSGAIAGALEKDGVVELHAIGAGAVNQTVKAIAIARRLLEKEGDPPVRVVPGFMELQIDGELRTGMRFIVERPARMS
ncbi:MAG: stage V sporulation protein S [Thermotogota bacterium]